VRWITHFGLALGNEMNLALQGTWVFISGFDSEKEVLY
jgi:hypothetical protein